MFNIPWEALVCIDQIYYKQEPLINPKVGMLILDTQDGTYAYIDMVHNPERVVIKEKEVAEVGVPITRLRLLTPTISPDHKN